MVLRSRIVDVTPRVSNSLILGRAVCGEGTWLLTDSRDLIQLVPAAFRMETRRVHGWKAADNPWGLACLSDRSLWTLADPRSLARISPDGRIAERLPLPFAAVALFASGDRLLFQRAPPIAGAALFVSRAARSSEAPRLWPGLVGRPSAVRTELFARNLATCGLGEGDHLPCWFADDLGVAISEGVRARQVSWPFVAAADVDPEAPIRDVALAPGGRAWILATSRRSVDGRRSGGRLLLLAGGNELARVNLVPEARLIISADRLTCVLLSVSGEWIEVRAQ